MKLSCGRLLVLVACVACAARAAAEPGPDLSKGGRIHVAAIQVTRVGDDLAANRDNIERLVREAAGRGARYILLPEYFPGQMVNNAASTVDGLRASAEPLDGPIARHMLALCRALNVYIGFPLAERRADGKVYNSTVYAGPHGVEGVYSKRWLVTPRALAAATKERPARGRGGRIFEVEIFEPGKSDGVVTWGGVRIGTLICADGGDRNAYRGRLAKGVQMFTHTSGSIGSKVGPRNPMPEVVAKTYRRPVIFANHWVDHWIYAGNTQICDAQGNILARVGAEPNVVIDALVDLPPVDAPAGPAPGDAGAAH